MPATLLLEAVAMMPLATPRVTEAAMNDQLGSAGETTSGGSSDDNVPKPRDEDWT